MKISSRPTIGNGIFSSSFYRTPRILWLHCRSRPRSKTKIRTIACRRRRGNRIVIDDHRRAADLFFFFFSFSRLSNFFRNTNSSGCHHVRAPTAERSKRVDRFSVREENTISIHVQPWSPRVLNLRPVDSVIAIILYYREKNGEKFEIFQRRTGRIVVYTC